MKAAHEILEIDVNATKKEAQKARNRLLRAHHPDVHPSEMALEKNAYLIRLNAAYEEFCQPGYAGKQAQRQAAKNRSKTRPGPTLKPRNPATTDVVSVDAELAQEFFDWLCDDFDKEAVFSDLSRGYQKFFWFENLWNFVRLRFSIFRPRPVLLLAPHKVIFDREAKEYIIFTYCSNLAICPTYFVVHSLPYIDSMNVQDTIPVQFLMFHHRDQAYPHHTRDGLKVAEFKVNHSHLTKVSVICEQENRLGSLGLKTHKRFYYPKDGLLKYYWKLVYPSDKVMERAFR